MISWNTFIRSKFTSWLLTMVLVGVAFFSGRMYLEKREINSEIAKLQAQADLIKKENDDLSGLIKYWNTTEFQEREAREKLNLKKEGEFVVVLPESEETVSGASTNSREKSNINKWFDYFFNN